MIDKTILLEYMDACELVEETQAELDRACRGVGEVVHDSVKGSNPNFPYEPMSFHIAGVAVDYTTGEIMHLRKVMTERKDAAKAKRIQVEEWINTIPVRMQRIIRYKYLQGLTWQEVGNKMGCGTGEAVRKEAERFLKSQL